MSQILDPIPEPKIYWQGRSLDERLKWKSNFFITYPLLKKLTTHFVEKLEHCERTKEHSSMFLIGGSGVGKTALTMRFKQIAESLYARHDDEKTICPVLEFAIPTKCTPVQLSAAILTALGEEQPFARGKDEKIHLAAEKYIIECEVRLVLIDNVQDIPQRIGKRGTEKVGARIRTLIDKSQALWVLLGTEEAKQVVDSEKQLIKRAAYREHLEYFNIETPIQKSSFKRLLIEIDKWLPLTEETCLTDPKINPPMFYASEGIFDRIIQLIDRALYKALIAGNESFNRADLEEAFVYVYGPSSSRFNPFSEGFEHRRLRSVNEPFEFLHGGRIADRTSKTASR